MYPMCNDRIKTSIMLISLKYVDILYPTYTINTFWSIPGLIPQLLLRPFEVEIPKLGNAWPGKVGSSLNTTKEDFPTR